MCFFLWSSNKLQLKISQEWEANGSKNIFFPIHVWQQKHQGHQQPLHQQNVDSNIFKAILRQKHCPASFQHLHLAFRNPHVFFVFRTVVSSKFQTPDVDMKKLTLTTVCSECRLSCSTSLHKRIYLVHQRFCLSHFHQSKILINHG